MEGEPKQLSGWCSILFKGSLISMDAHRRWSAFVEVTGFLLSLNCSDLLLVSLRLFDTYKLKCWGRVNIFKRLKEKGEQKGCS